MEDRGPFDRILRTESPPEQRDRAAFIVVGVSIVLGLLLLVLVLPPISILKSGGGSTISSPVTAVLRDQIPAPPDGFEAVSGLFDLSSPEPVDRPARLTVNLSTHVQTDEQLRLYTYQDSKWRALGSAAPVAGGEAAQGDVTALPANVAVFRPVQQTRAVAGSLLSGAQLDPKAPSSLTVLHLRGFEPAADGSITGGQVTAPAGATLPVAPTISSASPGTVANVNAILASDTLRTAHVQAIRAFATQNNVDAIEIDYEQIDPQLHDNFTAFVRDLSSALSGDGRSLTLALPVPVRTGDAWDTKGYNWDALAPLVSSLTIGMVADQDAYYLQMEDALSYLVPRVGGGKLLLSVSPLSRERSVDGVRTVKLTDALALAAVPATQSPGPVATGSDVQAIGQNLGATADGGLQWDDAARAVSFTYTGGGGQRTVWLADIFSEAFKLDLARRYQLGGVAIDDVSSDNADAGIWPAVQQFARTGTIDLVKPNGDLLQPHWAASGGQFASDVGAAVTWHAPNEAGDYTLTLIVSDGLLRVAQELALVVEARAGALAP